jgi:hypothetical protein
MSGATESLTFALAVDASQADAQLARTRAGAMNLGGGFGSVTSNLEKLDRAEREVSKGLRGLSGAMGGLSTQTINAIGPLGDIAGMMSGGALTIGLAAAADSVALLTKHWEKEAEARMRAIDAQFAQFDAINAVTKRMYSEIEGLRKDLAPEATAKDIYAGMEREQDAIDVKLAELRAADRDVSAAGRAGHAARDAEIKQYEKQRSLLEEIANLKVAKMGKDAAALKPIRSEPRAGGAPGGGGDEYDPEIAFLEYQAKLNQEATDFKNKKRMEDFEAQQRAEQEMLDAEKKRHDERVLLAQEANDKIVASYSGMATEIGEGAFSNLVGAGQSAIDDIVSGQEYAAERAMAAFMRSTGQQIVGVGTKAVWEGITMNAVVPGSGVPAMAAGAAAIAAGIGMGAAGSAMTASMSRADAQNAGRGTLSRDREMMNERGTGSVRGGGGGGGGRGSAAPVNVTVNYGVGGPPAEDTAREVARAIEKAHRRGFGSHMGRGR